MTLIPRAACLLLGLCLAVLPLTAAAAQQSVTIGVHSLQVPVPDGLCALDPGRAADAQVIRQHDEAAGSLVRFFSYAAGCEDLAARRAGTGDQLSPLMFLAIPNNVLNQPVTTPRADLVALVARQLDSPDMADRLQDLTQELRRSGRLPIELDQGRPLGVVDQSEDHVTAAMVQSVALPSGETAPFITVFALTRLGTAITYVYRSEAVDGRVPGQVIDAAAAELGRYVGRLIQLNP